MRTFRFPHSHLQGRFALQLIVAGLMGLVAATICSAQDVSLNVTYVCNGEHIYVDSCNMRDLSDNATCMVEHPDHVNAGGLAAITSETRGSLKKRLPTCVQPSAREQAAHAAFLKKQQEIYDANVARANPQPAPQPGNQGGGRGATGIVPPKNAEERAIRRCVSSGRLPATCTGNSLLGAFGQMINQVASGLTGKDASAGPAPGPELAGVFEGPGRWRLDFIDGGVLVNCSYLSPNQESYTIDFRTGRAVITVNTRPKPLVLTLNGSETITGPGPVILDGVIATGPSNSGPDPTASSGYTDQYGMALNNQQAASSSEVYKNGERHYGPVASSGSTYNTFAARRVTCPALNLSSKGASTGMQTMQTNLLKAMFSDGDKGPPTPPGIRMHGIYAASTGFSVQFYPESVLLGCGPDAARAYPYTVVAEGGRPSIQIAAADHPLSLAFGPNNSLIPDASGPYQVHGRIVTGTNDNDDFTFSPMEETCELATLTPTQTIPSTGGSASMGGTMSAGGSMNAGGAANSGGAAGSPSSASYNNAGRLSTPAAPLGNATLAISSGLPAAPGQPNPLARRPYVLLRDSYGGALTKGGVQVPPGTSPYKYVGTVCAPSPTRTPACQQAMSAINNDAASAARADANGSATLPGVPPGTYYLMISTFYNNQPLVWSQPVQLRPGPNTLTLDQRNATPVN